MRTIAVVNQKGGCGKTITSINLAAFLALERRRVLLVDLDPQGHATLGVLSGSVESPTMFEMFLAEPGCEPTRLCFATSPDLHSKTWMWPRPIFA